MKRFPLNVLTVIAALLYIFPAWASAAAASSAAARLPEGANAVLTLDVVKLIASPWGKQAKLQSQLAAGQADRPLPVSASTKRLTVGAFVHPTSMDSLWQAAVVELAAAPRLDPILRAQGGYLDEIGGKQAAWSPRDVFYVVLDDRTLGVVRPGQRQVVSRWVSAKSAKGASPYITRALESAGEADGVFAIDLDDVIGVTALQYALDMGQLPSLEPVEGAAQAKLIAAIASVKGITITLHAGSALEGRCTIDFEQDVSALSEHVKPFVKDVLTLAESYEPDMDQWNFKVEGKRITGKRNMTEEGLKRMLGLLSPPATATAAAALEGDGMGDGSAGSGSAPKPSGTPTAKASQEYYKAVSKKLDTIGAKASPTATAGSLIALSKEIEQLSILNVDPALITWGGAVANTFARAAQELALGQQQAKVAAEGVASPTSYTTYNSNGSANNNTPETRAAYRNAQQQRRAASQAQRGAAADRAFAVLNEVLPTRAKVRAEMTQKYGVEF